jgi:hypothetical protein
LGKDPTGKDVLIKYGAFIQNIIDFLIIAFVLFCTIKFINRLKKPHPAPVAAAPPPRQEVLLEEIRDLLAKRELPDNTNREYAAKEGRSAHDVNLQFSASSGAGRGPGERDERERRGAGGNLHTAAAAPRNAEPGVEPAGRDAGDETECMGQHVHMLIARAEEREQRHAAEHGPYAYLNRSRSVSPWRHANPTSSPSAANTAVEAPTARWVGGEINMSA